MEGKRILTISVLCRCNKEIKRNNEKKEKKRILSPLSLSAVPFLLNINKKKKRKQKKKRKEELSSLF